MTWGGLVCGVGLALLNGLITWLSIRRSWDSPSQRFFTLFLGGMVLRFVLTVAASAVLLLLTPIDPGYFVAGLGVTYILIFIIEIVAVVRRTERERA